MNGYRGEDEQSRFVAAGVQSIVRTLHVIERPASGSLTEDASRPGIGAAGAVLSHAAVIALVIAIMRLGPQQLVSQTLQDRVSLPLTWIPHDAGGGHEGGGDRSAAPARRQETPGNDELSIATAITPSTASLVEPDVEPLPILAKPADAGVASLVGAIASERPGDSPGANAGDGGDGDGPPAGRGNGPSSGLGSLPRSGGPGVTTPIVIMQVKPQYTADAMRAKVQGLVMVECVVMADGTVADARIARSLDPVFGLDQAALIAAKKWRFRPGLVNGIPVPVVVTIELSFTLR